MAIGAGQSATLTADPYGIPVKDWLLYAFAALYPLMVFAVFMTRDSIPFWIVIVMAGLLVFEFLRTGGELWVDRSFTYLVALVAVYVVATYAVNAQDSGVTWLGRSVSSRAVTTTMRMLYVALAFIVFANLLADAPEHVFVTVLRIQLAVGLGIAAFGILQYVTFTFMGITALNDIEPTNETFGGKAYYLQRFGTQRVFRAAGIFKEPSMYGFYLVPLVIKYQLAWRAGLLRGNRVLLLAGITVFGIALITNFSLTGILTVGVMLLGYALSRLRHSVGKALLTMGLSLAFIVILGFTAVGTALLARLENVIALRDLSTLDRSFRVYTSFLVWWDHPILGVGPGGYAFWYPRLGGIDATTMVTPLNIWLNVLTDVGIVGFLLFLGFLGSVLRRGFAARWQHPLVRIFFWSAVSLLVLLTTADIWYVEFVWFEFAMLLALSSSVKLWRRHSGIEAGSPVSP